MTTATVSPQLPIHPIAAYDPKIMEVSNARWSRVWALAAIVSAVAFIAFASVAFAYATVYLESQLPVVAILLFAIGLPSSFRAFSYMWDKSEGYAQEARIDKKMVTSMNTIRVTDELKRLGVKPDTPDIGLKPLIARYNYCQERKEKLLEKAQSILEGPVEISLDDRIHSIDPADYTIEKVDFSSPTQKSLFENLQMNRAARELLIHHAAEFQLKSAYYLLLMKNAYEDRPESEFMQHANASLPHRLIANEYGDLSSRILIKTAGGNYTPQQILDRTTYQLAKEIFGLPKAGLFS